MPGIAFEGEQACAFQQPCRGACRRRNGTRLFEASRDAGVRGASATWQAGSPAVTGKFLLRPVSGRCVERPNKVHAHSGSPAGGGAGRHMKRPGHLPRADRARGRHPLPPPPSTAIATQFEAAARPRCSSAQLRGRAGGLRAWRILLTKHHDPHGRHRYYRQVSRVPASEIEKLQRHRERRLCAGGSQPGAVRAGRSASKVPIALPRRLEHAGSMRARISW